MLIRVCLLLALAAAPALADDQPRVVDIAGYRIAKSVGHDDPDGAPVLLTLQQTKIHLWISTMASFRPDGKLFVGNSIEPDTVVARQPADWTGQTDSELAAALKLLGGT